MEAPLVRVAAASSGAPAFRQEADRRRAERFHLQPRHVDLHELALAVLARLLPGVVDGGPARGVVFQGRLGHCVSFLMGMAVPPRGRASRRVVGAIAGVEGRGTPNNSYFSFRSLSASPRLAPALPFRAVTLAPRVRIAPERSAFYRPRASALVGGRVSVPDLASVELSALPGQTRPAFSRSASSLDGGPAVVRGGRIRRGWPQTRGAPPNRLSASRARWMRSTGRRRRPRPTSRRLMARPSGGRDGQKQPR